MRRFVFDNLTVYVDFKAGCVKKLCLKGKNRLAGEAPLFRVCMRDIKGEPFEFTAFDAKKCAETKNGAVYGFDNGASVTVSLDNENGSAAWRLNVRNVPDGRFVEWVEFGMAVLPKLRDNNEDGNGGSVLFPYNEGVLVSDYSVRERTSFLHWPLEYPSYGSLAMFPNMGCSQMLAYLFDDAGLYFGAHDPERGLKGVDYFDVGSGIEMRFRIFSGAGFGEDYDPGFPVVWSGCGPSWEDAALIYRKFFEENLPAKARKISENEDLPEWYPDSPLVVSYPVRGVHDMDEMKPNAFFPYSEALPVLDKIKEKTGARILALLMHWEGTAPWAPPYVWPPYGGEDMFAGFKNALHERGMLLGVYCSGFGYTIKSNLNEYDMTKEFERRGLEKAMCAGPDGRVLKSNICPGQRSGYDICPATEKGKEALDEAYGPLFESGADYAQILDQNHGGGQYLCYGRDHGHPPAPGKWMTSNMQKLLSGWNEKAGKMILGCESAAAEPFIGNLLLSDNRYELNYYTGIPVPFYQFVYHKYVRNFMGNQVSCPLEESTLTYCYRLAYSFACGDCMTVVLNPTGGIFSSWGIRDFSKAPDEETVWRFIANLTEFYKTKAKKYLYNGEMQQSPDIKIPSYSFRCKYVETDVDLPYVICTAWKADDGERALIAVNPSVDAAEFEYNGKTVTVPALDAALIKI